MGTSGAVPGQAQISVTDDSGRELSLTQPATRIISLAPHLTELLFAAGAGDHMVAAVAYSDYPPAAADLPRVGDAHNLDVERILALRPDLVVGWGSGNNRAQLEQLAHLELPLYLSEPGALDSIAATIVDLGRLAGTRPAAETAAAEFRQRLQSLRNGYADHPTVSVFYQYWHRPIMTIGGRHLIDEVIRLCGGENIFADLHQLAPQVEREAVLQADPAVIIGSGEGTRRPPWLDEWSQWPQLRAVRNGHVFDIPADLLLRHSSRLLDGAELLCEQLQQVRAQAGR